MRNVPPASQARKARLRLRIRGAVQGVGFRPFIYRMATERGLAGWVNNSAQGVSLEVEGAPAELQRFLSRLEAEAPPRSIIQKVEASWLAPVSYDGFSIRESEAGGRTSAVVLPDLATCPACLREIFDPRDRRFRYPFTNCTHCGPRFSIVEAVPYDRPNTSMKKFAMCPRCQAEYDNPADRRFHAQPNACPDCGPRLQFDDGGRGYAADAALRGAAGAIRDGLIVAVKGIGGFHLFVDARNEWAVRKLRERKQREAKPLALMCPSVQLVRAFCLVSDLEERLLCSPEAPIVLLKRKPEAGFLLADAIAPGNPNLGVMVPSNPLHHLLMAELGSPVVATSGNVSDEPICIEEAEARERLAGIADAFLVHDRPIVRQVDDSLARVVLDREMILRRARGYAPLPIELKGGRDPGSESILAAGAHLKNAVALAIGRQVFLSQHIGDLDTEQAANACHRVIVDFQRLYQAAPAVLAADLHPDYLSTRIAEEGCGQGRNRRLTRAAVQHHVSHVLACMAENQIEPPLLGVAWDGTGYGLDGTVWGGEFFMVSDSEVERAGHLRPFRLPGGDLAIQEPRRAALGLLYEWKGAAVLDAANPVRAQFSEPELRVLERMLERKINCPITTSAGRLFDAVASILGLRPQIQFEGQAAMELEFTLEGITCGEAYAFEWREPPNTKPPALMLDWAPVIAAILVDRARGVPAGVISMKFHRGLAAAVVMMARRLGQRRIVLSGGCFQNRYLLEQTVQRLREANFEPYWPRRVPPNDGGIALGQIAAARRQS